MIINNIFFNIYYLPRYVEEWMAKDWTSMAFSSHVLQLRLLMGVAAMKLSVWHHIASGKGPGHEWYGDISIKQTGAQRATCISMPKPAGVQRLLVKHWKQRTNLLLMRSVKAFQNQTFRMEQLPPSLRERGREMFHSQ